jgi:hypothetical protein
MTRDGISGLQISLLCETHSSGATRREKSLLLTAPVRLIGQSVPAFSPGPLRFYSSLEHSQHGSASKTSTSSPSSSTTNRWPM